MMSQTATVMFTSRTVFVNEYINNSTVYLIAAAVNLLIITEMTNVCAEKMRNTLFQLWQYCCAHEVPLTKNSHR